MTSTHTPLDPLVDLQRLITQTPQVSLRTLRGNINKLSSKDANRMFKTGDIRSSVEEAETLMFHAVRHHRQAAVVLLLGRGAKPHLSRNDGTNVLHLMAKHDQLDLAKYCFRKVPMPKRLPFVNAADKKGNK